jgi:hypothetical protein
LFNLIPRQRLAALCLFAGLFPACAGQPEAASVGAASEALSLAGGLDIKPVMCGSALESYDPLSDVPDGTGTGGGDVQSLEAYTEECEAAIGFTLPDVLDCEIGTRVPGQDVTCDAEGVLGCDQPNVLNSECDPGSKFQRLVSMTPPDANAAAVMHCRRMGAADGFYRDIAIIMANKKTGATCFFQAFRGDMPGENIPSPKKGTNSLWDTPEEAEGRGCVGCHDNGSFLRSAYIAQMTDMPTTRDGFGNDGTVVRWVGKAFSERHSWSVKVDNACLSGTGPDCLTCTTCHNLAVNDYNKYRGVTFPLDDPNWINRYQEFGHFGAWDKWGTAIDFGPRATAQYQRAKHAHSEASPIWMTPSDTFYDERVHQIALAYATCAAEFANTGFDMDVPLSAGCSVTPLGGPWVKPGAAAQP